MVFKDIKTKYEREKKINIFVDDPYTFLILLFSYFANINYDVVSKIFVYIFCSKYANLHIKKALTQTTKFNGKGV